MEACKSFASGCCARDSLQDFEHQRAESLISENGVQIQQENRTCSYFQHGRCRYGAACTNRHNGEENAKELELGHQNGEDVSITVRYII